MGAFTRIWTDAAAILRTKLINQCQWANSTRFSLIKSTIKTTRMTSHVPHNWYSLANVTSIRAISGYANVFTSEVTLA